ncbi:MAG TPA: MazG-like family protein [Bacillota bacterium]|nr:MazG-like family protein [Bacillota bacterium]HPL53434.1 MazG-like family protein [Bacillota bacterium]
MRLLNQDTDITKNIRIIEFLKSELLTTVASLYQGLLKGTKVGQEVIQDTLANLVLVTYLLGKRLGISYSLIDSRMLEKIRIGMLEEHETEKWYGDLTDLSEYLKKKKG